MPKNTPLASGACKGVLSPAKYGRLVMPPAPGEDSNARVSQSATLRPGKVSPNHLNMLPTVDMPPVSTKAPGCIKFEAQKERTGKRFSVLKIKKLLLPYIIIISPVLSTPAPRASDAASMVPVMTGTPGGRPVSAAASAVSSPATWVLHKSSGSLSISVMKPASCM